LLAHADGVANGPSDIINLVELAALLRITRGLTKDDIAKLSRNAQKARDR